MRPFLLLLFLSLLMVACAKSYIDIRYNEPYVEKTTKEQEDDEFATLRNSYNVPLDLGLFE